MENKKILIIEDDANLRNVLEEFFEAEKMLVKTASDGESGLKSLRDFLPDVVLLDIILPKKDGYEIIKEIKSDEKIKDIPVILLTNLGGLNDIEKALALGATTYLVKGDYQVKEIVEKVKEVLET
ncbi:MAG: response regulator [Candidatus Moranbacteria bacterium]|jgi:DNA-binding response OmpR family regulator|nr:response regulator [Candidatus Moranbacteria bacterium]NCA93865.1 response regulator [Sphingobacteriia bacterium]NLC31153.1 response regulator [Candidatus Moranbacteria bacterium]